MKPLYAYIVLLFSLALSGREIEPAFTMHSRGLVNDFVIDGLELYVANDEGSVEVFDLRSRKKSREIFLPPHKLTDGTLVTAKVLSVDRYAGKTLIVSTAERGYRNVWLHDGTKLRLILPASKKIAVKKPAFSTKRIFYSVHSDTTSSAIPQATTTKSTVTILKRVLSATSHLMKQEN